jgi:hypothetical protein
MSKLIDNDKLFRYLYIDDIIENYKTLKDIVFTNPHLFDYLASTKYITNDQYNELKELAEFLKI